MVARTDPKTPKISPIRVGAKKTTPTAFLAPGDQIHRSYEFILPILDGVLSQLFYWLLARTASAAWTASSRVGSSSVSPVQIGAIPSPTTADHSS